VAFLIFLFLCLFSTSSIAAAPVVNITVAPTSAISGSTIPVQFTIENSNPNVSYYYKFFGGIDSSTTQIQTTSDLTYTSAWNTFSSVIVDSDGKKSVDSYAYIVPNTISGTYNLFVRIAKVDSTSSTYTSSAFTFLVSGLTPTPTTVPTSTPTPTNTPTPTATPTPDATITNPSSGIKLTEYMPYSDPEWIEIYNENDYPVKLVSWKVEDNNGNTKNIDNLSISAKNYAIYELKSLIFNNNDDEKVILRDQNNNTRSETSYSKGLLTVEKSWSYISGSWCQSSITKGYENVTSCASTSTPTPTTILTPTPTPNSTKYVPDESATASAIIEPKTESSFLTPTSIPSSTSTVTNGLILGNSTSSSSATKKNYFPLILIISGGLLLTSPAIINKINSKK
jgi:hypothetical protein